MKFNGFYELNSSKKEAWENLNNIDVLKKCISGCKEFISVGQNKYNAEILVKLGPVNATFRSTIEINNIKQEESYEIYAQGNAGQLGNASGTIKVTLKELDKKTILNYEADTRINGRIAQLGSRLIDGSVKKNADLFFKNFSERLSKDQVNNTTKEKNYNIFGKLKLFTYFIILLSIILFMWVYVR